MQNKKPRDFLMLDKSDKYLITGASGFLGETVIKRLINMGYTNLVALSRNEGQLIKLKEKFPIVQIITGDVAEQYVCNKAFKDVGGVFHSAAFKHIGLAEENPLSCINSNVIGSINVIKASMEWIPKFVIGISTDKAAQVSGVYGATKMLMEKLFLEAERINGFTSYRLVRYGNILYSTGSVLCKWKEAIEKNKEIIITDPNATRFYWTVEQAVDLIFECLDNAIDSTPYMPKMKSIKVGDLLDAMVDKYAKERPIVKYIGLQPGENMHETIDGKVFSNQVEQYTLSEIKQMV